MAVPLPRDHCVGYYDRHGAPADTQNGHTGYRSVFSGFVPTQSGVEGIPWSIFQPDLTYAPNYVPGGSGGPHGRIKTGVIETYLNSVDTYNLTGPTLLGTTIPLPWNILIRPFAGRAQPGWLKTAYGTVTNGTDTLSPYWTSTYQTVARDFATQLANYVPTDNYNSRQGTPLTLDLHPYVGGICFFGMMTTYPEPLLITGWNQSQLGNPSNATVQAAYKAQYSDLVAAWPNTPVEFSHNPAAFGGETFTEAMMTYEVAHNPSPKGVVCNNSLRFINAVPTPDTVSVYPPFILPWPGVQAQPSDPGPYHDALGYTAMYEFMMSLGPGNGTIDLGFPRVATPSPLAFQTSTYAKLGGTPTSLLQTIDYAIWQGARKIELPSDGGGYNNLTPAQLAPAVVKLFANDPAPAATGQILQHFTGGTPSASTTLTVTNVATQAGSTLVMFVGARGSSTQPAITVTGGGTWNARTTTGTASLNGIMEGLDCEPVTSVGASAITISTSVSASIVYEFFEISGLAAAPYENSSTANATGATTAPSSGALTPGNSTDVVVGAIFWPNATATITGLPASPWVNDPTVVGTAP